MKNLLILLALIPTLAFGQSLPPQCWDTLTAGTKSIVYDMYLLQRGALVPYCIHPNLQVMGTAIHDSLNAHPGGSGTVTTVSVVTANGVSGSVATATTTPAITLTLGAITPTSIGSATTATTQSPRDSSTKIATTAYVDAGAIQFTQVNVTSAQLLTCNSVPVQCIAAPGTGKVIAVISAYYDYTAATVGYSGGAYGLYENISFTAIATIPNSGNLMTGTSSGMKEITKPAATATGGNLTDNASLVFYSPGGNPLSGDGTVKISIYYYILTR